MTKLAVFAHYDKDNIIDDYVIYYLQALKKICQTVVFVSCCDLSAQELGKLKDIADFSIAERHNEYDFGSYKRGFLLLAEKNLLSDASALIFANDSCYAPLFQLEQVFSQMEKQNCDFWGITKNKFGLRKRKQQFQVCVRPHLQSYFLVFNNNVFTSKEFFDFITGVCAQEHKNDVVINYEIGLSEHLEKLGFKSGVFVKDFYNVSNATILKWRQLIPKSPFIKCNLLRQAFNNITTVENWQEQITKYCEYPTELIAKNLNRTKIKSAKSRLPLKVQRLIFDTMSYMPNSLRRIFAIIIGKLQKSNIL